MLYRPFAFCLVIAILAAGAGPSLAYTSQSDAAFNPHALVYRLNGEGDEWFLVDENSAEPSPPAPAFMVQNEAPGDPIVSPSNNINLVDVDLARALDEARDAGSQAVLAFIAAQPDSSHALLQAAAADALLELQESDNRSPAAPTAPRVSINSGPCVYETIQEAIDAAASGSTIRISADDYIETFNVSAKTLVIEGGYDSTCTTLDASSTTQVDANSAGGSVVDVSGAAVLELRNLRLTGGTSFGAGLDVLGGSRVRLTNTDIFGNNGGSGAGMYIGGTSVLTYTTNSDIYSNVSSSDGGGAIVYGKLYGFDSNSDIYQNSAVNGGGIAVNGGEIHLDNSDLMANTASNFGGGIYSSNGVVTLSNSVFVGEISPCCQTAVDGGGIYASGGHVSLLGPATSVVNNTATGNGGGIYLTNGATLDVTGGSLGYDTSASSGNDAVLGAGMYVTGSTVNFSGRIINNNATNSGGGLYSDNSTLTIHDATIGGTGAYHHNRIGATGLNGAGIYLINNTRATLDDTTIISNTLSNTATGYAGGIYVRAGSAITLTHSTVEQHSLPSAFDGRGAAMYIYDATVTMSNTQVISNTTQNLAGGVRMFGASTLNVLGGSSFVNNEALGGVGGAIAATNTPTILFRDSSVANNSASSHGGAIYLDAGRLDFEGSWQVRDNTAGGNGGALAVVGTGDVDFRATGGPGASTLASNHAQGDGGGLYIANNDPVTLYATSGYPIALNGNSAGRHGGAIYANSGAFLDGYGDLQATSNNAGGNGGVFYLAGGSRLWLDDYFDQPGQIGVNTADNGGAIYASNSPRVECDGTQFGLSDNGNRATSGSGGAIYLSGSTLTSSNCIFRNNQAQAGNGGAIAAYTSTVTINADYPVTAAAWTEPQGRAAPQSPAAPQATACDPRTRQCSSFYLNTATASVSNGYGGAIYSNRSALKVRSTFLHRNLAQRGGAIYQEGTGATGAITTTLVYSNTSLQSFGAGIRVAGGAITIRDSTLANNIGGAGYSPGSAQSYIYNTIIWGNSVAAFGAITTAVCNIDQGGTAGPALNPRFVAPGGGENYYLAPASPAIDACSSGLPRDLLNAQRPQGGNYDMGVYEAPGWYLFLPITGR